MSQTTPIEPRPPALRYAIIPHPSLPHLLLLPGENGWRLPSWEAKPEARWTCGSTASDAIASQLGLRVTMLRAVRIVPEPESEQHEREYVYWMENHSPEWVPAMGARWVDRTELDRCPLAVPHLRPNLESWLRESLDGALPRLRSPWARPGWYADATAWIHERLEPLGITVTGPIEQQKSTTISCLLCANTTSGALYMKAAPPMFAVEARLTQRLAEQWPHCVPTLLALDGKRNWMLMRDMEGGPLGGCSEILRWEQALGDYARIQRDLAASPEALLALGCRDRRLDRLAASLESLVETVAAQPEGGGIAEAEIARLRTILPLLKAMCEELASYPIPATLEHGDLHPWNIAVRDEQCILYDWSDACLSHPFFSLATVCGRTAALAAVPEAESRLRDCYLAAWTEFAPMERLREAFELALTLAQAHLALSYVWIDAHLEESARWEWAGATVSWLKRLLQRCETSPSASGEA
jgi:hypothetical protein